MSDPNENEWQPRWILPPPSPQIKQTETTVTAPERPAAQTKDYWARAKEAIEREARARAAAAPKLARTRAASKRRQAHRQVARLAKITRARLTAGA